MNMSQARSYEVGGTVRIVINNQVGFTTSDPLNAYSTLYYTNIAKNGTSTDLPCQRGRSRSGGTRHPPGIGFL